MRPSEPVPTVWKMDAVPREGKTEEMTAASMLLLVDAADGRLLIEPGHFPAGHLLFGCLEQGYTTLGVYGMGARVYDPSLMRFLTPDLPKYLDPMARYGLNVYCYCYNDPFSYVDNTGHAPEWWNPTTWNWGEIGKGIGLLLLGAGAIVAGIATLPFGGWAAVLGGATILAGGGTAVFGLADTWEGMSGYNGLRETVFMGDSQAYDVAESVFMWAAIIGTVACGLYGLTHTSLVARSLPTRSNPNSAVFKWMQRTLGYYGSDGCFRYSVSLFNNHGLPGRALIHWHLENPLSHWHSDPINNVFEFLWHLFGGFF